MQWFSITLEVCQMTKLIWCNKTIENQVRVCGGKRLLPEILKKVQIWFKYISLKSNAPICIMIIGRKEMKNNWTFHFLPLKQALQPACYCNHKPTVPFINRICLHVSFNPPKSIFHETKRRIGSKH